MDEVCSTMKKLPNFIDVQEPEDNFTKKLAKAV